MKLKDMEKYTPLSVRRQGRTAERKRFWQWAPYSTEQWLEKSAADGSQLYLAHGDDFYFARSEPKTVKYRVTYGASMPDDIVKKNRAAGWQLIQAKGSAALWVNECTKDTDPVFEEKSMGPTWFYFLWNTVGYIVFITLFIYIILSYLKSSGITMENFSFILVFFSIVNICAMGYYVVKLVIGLRQVLRRKKSESERRAEQGTDAE